MAYFPFMSRYSIILLVLFCCTVEPVPHIIGGGWNMVNAGRDNSVVNTSFLKSVLPTLRLFGFRDQPTSNANTRHVSEKQNKDRTNSDTIEYQSDSWVNTVDQMSSIALPPPAVAGSKQANQLFRQKRRACKMFTNQNVSVTKLKSVLNDTVMLGVNPTSASSVEEPSNQPSECPNTKSSNTSWWPNRPESNFRGVCPWNLTKVDLGVNAYPRFVLTAMCLCQKCVKDLSKRCANFRQDFTYFEYVGCHNGLAVMTKKTINIVVACYCVHASPQSGQVLGTTDPPSTDVY